MGKRTGKRSQGNRSRGLPKFVVNPDSIPGTVHENYARHLAHAHGFGAWISLDAVEENAKRHGGNVTGPDIINAADALTEKLKQLRWNDKSKLLARGIMQIRLDAAENKIPEGESAKIYHMLKLTAEKLGKHA